MKILLVEDDEKVGLFIEKRFSELAYTVKRVVSCEDAADALCETAYDCIILDLGLPDGDGLSLLAEWRKAAFEEPVLILSARDEVEDRIRGLNLGADDYLPKPFSFDELLARVRSLMRRQSPAKTALLQHGGVRMDLLSHTVRLEDEPVELTNREFSLLELFLQNRGRILTRTQIAEKIWDAHFELETNLIDVYVRKLRKKLAGEEGGPIIKTVRGVGYKLG